MSKLVSYVHVLIPEGQENAGQTVAFGPDDKVPDWAAKQMGAHCFVDGKHPLDKAAKKAAKAKTAAPDEAPSGGTDAEPPRAGAGSGRDAWAAFAEARGHTVEEGATRDQIVASLTDAGVIVK